MGNELLDNQSISRRYRTLLEITRTVAKQPTLQAVLRSLHHLLSTVICYESAAIMLLSNDGKFLRLGALEKGPECPDIEIGTEALHTGTAAGRAVEEQRFIYVPNAQDEISKYPQAAQRAATCGLRSMYLFPISTPRRKIGVLSFGTAMQEEFSADDIVLMESVASHVATVLESALATDAAELYQKQLLGERDRWKLLLEINNHIISRLNVSKLFRVASVSIRKHFGNNFVAIWIFDKEQNQLDCAVLDSPDRHISLDEIPALNSSDEDTDKMKARRPEIWTRADIENLPPVLGERLAREGIESMAIAPLGTSNQPLGVIALGSRRPDCFGTADLDLLSQIGTQVSLALDNALAYRRLNVLRGRLENEKLYLESEIKAEYNFENIVGKSSSLRKVLEQIAIVAPTDSTVLLHGETGTGKELIARAIHSLSSRKSRTFVCLNCAAVPSGLVESELFGHERGAFTGAFTQRRGRFEIADQGTLFLDEVGDISIDLQPKLLRALEEREFERLGGTKTLHVDVRLIAATHRDLPGMIRNNQFRDDLFYRLNVFPIEIPPLRERRDDIPLLVHFFVSRLARRMQRDIRTIPKRAMEALTNAPWPGNVRELENFIERAVILTQGEELKIPIDELKKSSACGVVSTTNFEEAGRQAIINALKAACGKISGSGGAAERLGLKRSTLQNKMRALGISRVPYLYVAKTAK